MSRVSGVPLREMLGWRGPLTHRQYLTYLAWADLIEWGPPDKTQAYLMQLTAAVHNVLKSKGDTFTKVSECELKFGDDPKAGKRGGRVDPKHAEHISNIAKGAWMARAGVNTPQNPPGPGTTEGGRQ